MDCDLSIDMETNDLPSSKSESGKIGGTNRIIIFLSFLSRQWLKSFAFKTTQFDIDRNIFC